MQEYTANYQCAGGHTSFSDYYTVREEHAVFRPSLRDHVVFAHHNLVTDGSFNEFNLILCRNVAIYFNRKLRDRVFELLYDSLAHFGVLGVGHKESLHFTPHESCYEPLDFGARLYRKVR
jgi:chemotaxis protein methyltransferase CheR